MEKDLRLAKLWDEWLTSEINNSDFEASGLLMGMKFSGKFFQTNRLRTARRLMKIWPSTSYYEKYKFTPAISLITEKNHKARVKIECPQKILKFPKSLKASWAWLKGLWGSAGGLYFPKNGYYLTLIISDEKISRLISKIFERAGLAFNEHRNEITIRNHEDIMTFLSNMDMNLTALELGKTAIIRSVRNRANVESNYEAANIARTVKAAAEQLKLAKKFLSLKNSEALPEKLTAVAELRIKFPDDSLEELGKKLNPPIKKSAVKYRYNRIKNFLEKKIHMEEIKK